MGSGELLALLGSNLLHTPELSVIGLNVTQPPTATLQSGDIKVGYLQEDTSVQILDRHDWP